MRPAVFVLLSLAACSSDSDLPRTSALGVALTFPATFNADVTEVQLDVFDEFAVCDNDDVVGGSLLQSETLLPGVPTTIRVSPGSRAFLATGFDVETPVARGCERVILLEGQMLDLQIDMVETGGASDASLADE
jgi:hypothetical protein